MTVQFVNTTTYLPVDREIEALALKKLSKEFQDAALEAARSSPRRVDYLDIFFVEEEELDRDRKMVAQERDEEVDLLGIYFQHHQEFRRFIIKISPEKVMKACVSFKEQHPCRPTLAQIYPVLLISVIAHELAHLIMDCRADFYNDPMPWRWLSKYLEANPGYCFPRARLLPARGTLSRQWCESEHFIEESLANAFVLAQHFDNVELEFLKTFMRSQPPGYHEGVLWNLSPYNLLETAATWKETKRNAADARWNFIFQSGYPPVERLIHRMRSGQNTGSINFGREFFHYLLEKGEMLCDMYPSERDHLNGSFSILDVLSDLGERYGMSREIQMRLQTLYGKSVLGQPGAV